MPAPDAELQAIYAEMRRRKMLHDPKDPELTAIVQEMVRRGMLKDLSAPRPSAPPSRPPAGKYRPANLPVGQAPAGAPLSALPVLPGTLPGGGGSITPPLTSAMGMSAYQGLERENQTPTPRSAGEAIAQLVGMSQAREAGGNPLQGAQAGSAQFTGGSAPVRSPFAGAGGITGDRGRVPLKPGVEGQMAQGVDPVELRQAEQMFLASGVPPVRARQLAKASFLNEARRKEKIKGMSKAEAAIMDAIVNQSVMGNLTSLAMSQMDPMAAQEMAGQNLEIAKQAGPWGAALAGVTESVIPGAIGLKAYSMGARAAGNAALKRLARTGLKEGAQRGIAEGAGMLGGLASAAAGGAVGQQMIGAAEKAIYGDAYPDILAVRAERQRVNPRAYQFGAAASALIYSTPSAEDAKILGKLVPNMMRDLREVATKRASDAAAKGVQGRLASAVPTPAEWREAMRAIRQTPQWQQLPVIQKERLMEGGIEILSELGRVAALRGQGQPAQFNWQDALTNFAFGYIAPGENRLGQAVLGAGSGLGNRLRQMVSGGAQGTPTLDTGTPTLEETTPTLETEAPMLNEEPLAALPPPAESEPLRFGLGRTEGQNIDLREMMQNIVQDMKVKATPSNEGAFGRSAYQVPLSEEEIQRGFKESARIAQIRSGIKEILEEHAQSKAEAERLLKELDKVAPKREWTPALWERVNEQVTQQLEVARTEVEPDEITRLLSGAQKPLEAPIEPPMEVSRPIQSRGAIQERLSGRWPGGRISLSDILPEAKPVVTQAAASSTTKKTGAQAPTATPRKKKVAEEAPPAETAAPQAQERVDTNAIQEQGTDAGVLGKTGPEVGLPPVGEGNAPSEKPASTSAPSPAPRNRKSASAPAQVVTTPAPAEAAEGAEPATTPPLKSLLPQNATARGKRFDEELSKTANANLKPGDKAITIGRDMAWLAQDLPENERNAFYESALDKVTALDTTIPLDAVKAEYQARLKEYQEGKSPSYAGGPKSAVSGGGTKPKAPKQTKVTTTAGKATQTSAKPSAPSPTQESPADTATPAAPLRGVPSSFQAEDAAAKDEGLRDAAASAQAGTGRIGVAPLVDKKPLLSLETALARFRKATGLSITQETPITKKYRYAYAGLYRPYQGRGVYSRYFDSSGKGDAALHEIAHMIHDRFNVLREWVNMVPGDPVGRIYETELDGFIRTGSQAPQATRTTLRWADNGTKVKSPAELLAGSPFDPRTGQGQTTSLPQRIITGPWTITATPNTGAGGYTYTVVEKNDPNKAHLTTPDWDAALERVADLLNGGSYSPTTQQFTPGNMGDLLYRRGEGFAEWLRALAVNPQAAIAAAPNVYDAYMNTVPPPVQRAFLELGETFRRQRAAVEAADAKGVVEMAGQRIIESVKPNANVPLLQRIKQLFVKEQMEPGFRTSLGARFARWWYVSDYPAVAALGKIMEQANLRRLNTFAGLNFDKLGMRPEVRPITPSKDPIGGLSDLRYFRNKFSAILEYGMVNARNETVPGTEGGILAGLKILAQLQPKSAEEYRQHYANAVVFALARRTLNEAALLKRREAGRLAAEHARIDALVTAALDKVDAYKEKETKRILQTRHTLAKRISDTILNYEKMRLREKMPGAQNWQKIEKSYEQFRRQLHALIDQQFADAVPPPARKPVVGGVRRAHAFKTVLNQRRAASASLNALERRTDRAKQRITAAGQRRKDRLSLKADEFVSMRLRAMTGIADTTGESDEDLAQRIIKEFEKEPASAKAYAQLHDWMVNWSNAVLNYAYEKGRITEDEYLALKSDHYWYLPIQRHMGESHQAEDYGYDPIVQKILDAAPNRGPANVGFNTLRPHSVYQKFSGSTNRIIDPLTAMIENTAVITKEADRNAIFINIHDIIHGARGGMFNEKEAQSIFGFTLTGPVQTQDAKMVNGIAYYRDGVKHYMRIDDPYIYASLAEAGEIHLPSAFENAMMFMVHIQRANIVGSLRYLISNKTRDVQSALGISPYAGSIPLESTKTLGKYLTSRATKEEDRLYHLLGGGTSALTNLQVGPTQRKGKGQSQWYNITMRMIEDAYSGPDSLWNTAKRYGVTPFKYLFVTGPQSIREATEESTRVAESRMAKLWALSMGYDENEANIHSMREARALLDHQQGGIASQFITRYIAFFNAARQGQYANVQRAVTAWQQGDKSVGWHFIWRMLLRGMYFSVVMEFLTQELTKFFFGDEAIKEQQSKPPWQQYMFYEVKIAADTWLSIRKTDELSLPSSLLFQALRSIRSGNMEGAVYGVPEYLFKMLAPGVDYGSMNGPLSALVALYYNMDPETGRNIVSPFEIGKDLEMRDPSRAPNLSRWLTKGYNAIPGLPDADPRQVDYALKSTFADTYRQIAAGVDLTREDSRKTSLTKLTQYVTGLLREGPGEASWQGMQGQELIKKWGLENKELLTNAYQELDDARRNQAQNPFLQLGDQKLEDAKRTFRENMQWRVPAMAKFAQEDQAFVDAIARKEKWNRKDAAERFHKEDDWRKAIKDMGRYGTAAQIDKATQRLRQARLRYEKNVPPAPGMGRFNLGILAGKDLPPPRLPR